MIHPVRGACMTLALALTPALSPAQTVVPGGLERTDALQQAIVSAEPSPRPEDRGSDLSKSVLRPSDRLLPWTGHETQGSQKRRRDSLRNGALIGAAVGAVAGFVGGLAISHCSGPCDADYYSGERYIAPTVLGLLGAGAGAGIGAGIDALKHRQVTVLPGPRSRVRWLPLLTKDIQGVAAWMSF
jgi:hypothetical protein